MPLRIAVISFMLVSALMCMGQNTTRKGLKLKPSEAEPVETVDSTASVLSCIRLCGYEKAQTSQTESLFISNQSELPITEINITLTYLTVDGRQLHQRTETIKCDIPTGETRSINLKAWDKQKAWYYQGTQAKHNAYSSPFDVRGQVNWVKHD